MKTKFCARDSSENPTARNERGVVADSPTAGMPHQRQERGAPIQ